MYLKIDEELYKKITNRTITDYDKHGDYVPAENIISMIEDLVHEIESLEEKIEDINQDVEDNYRPVPVTEQCGISDRDFI